MTTHDAAADRPASQRRVTYENFHLRLDRFDAGAGMYRVSVADETPAGSLAPDQAMQGVYDPGVFWGDPGNATSSGLVGDLDEYAPDLEARLLELGTALADLALPAGPVRDLFQASRDALGADQGLRLWLDIAPSPLSHLPWEYLALPDVAETEMAFMGLRRDVSVVRGTPGDGPSGLPDRNVARVLGVAAEDATGPTFAVEAAVRNLNDAAQAALVELSGRSATDVADELARSLAGADFFHLLAAEPNIDAEGYIDLTQGETFATTRALGRELRVAGVRLTFLHALEPRTSSGESRWGRLAQALLDEGVPAVIANQLELDPDLLLRCLVPVYHRVLAGYTVDEAVYEARRSIAAWSDLAWAAPVLYLRAWNGLLFTSPLGFADTAAFRNVMRTFGEVEIDVDELAYGAGPPLAANGPPGDSYSYGPPEEASPPEPPRSYEGPEEAAPPEEEPREAPPEQARWINAEIDDQPPAQPLQVGQRYTLGFDVDTKVRDTAVGHAALVFEPEAEPVELTVQLESDDFTIHTGPQPLTVPPSGPSPDRAAFEIEPRQEGEGVITAVFLKDRNYVQSMTVRLQIGGPASAGMMATEVVGRALDAASGLKPRDLLLLVGARSDDAFPLTVVGPVADTTRLPFTLQDLDQMIEQARRDLVDIVFLRDEGQASRPRVYQDQLDIPAAVNEEALRRLAKRGFLLYQALFYGADADAGRRQLGDQLRAIAQQEQLKLQIVSQGFPIPWDILYVADTYDPDDVDPEMFLGFKHIIERIPRQAGLHVTRSEIPTQPPLSVSVNVNCDIDQRMNVTLIGDQVTYWEQKAQAGQVNVTVRETSDQVSTALAGADTADQIAYFNCHAESKSLSESGGPDASTLVMTGDGRLTLSDLKLLAPMHRLLPGAPLVFINACESAEMSPLFYDGFVPYFMAKGARGVIGTECEIPALFAAEFARRFFDRFLTGDESLGEVMHALRREFYAQHNNIMALLYAVYCDADTLVTPGIGG